MAKKNRPAIPKLVTPANINVGKPLEKQTSTGIKPAFLPRLAPYLPGIILFVIAFTVTLVTYKDYGVCWDEPLQRLPGLRSYNYVFHGSQDLFLNANDNHGSGFELVLMIVEKWLNITDSRDIYMMRHLVTDVFFLASVLAGYVLIFRLFKNKFIASIGFLMLILSPRIYAHSFFNSKDIPFMSMITISLAFCQYAFEKNRALLYFILGVLCGYATSIRIMGVMLGGIILFFLLIDLITSSINKESLKKPALGMVVFSVGFLLLVYLGWPYLWKHPIGNFIDSFKLFSHFNFKGSTLVNGKYEVAANLPWSYFPTWFLITNPEIWLITGLAGIVWIAIDFFKRPLTFFRNTTERNFLLYFVCFAAPILAVIFLHSVIYDDWRHLYFVYPPFVLMAVYFVNKIYQTKYKLIILSVCGLQAAVTGFFMVSNHPFNQVYFNNMVSHSPEYLRKNFELDYWGCSFKQGLEYLAAKYPLGIIRVYCNNRVFYDDNIMMLPEEERGRIQLADPENADFFITNFRSHPYDYPANKVEYSISVLNSTILCIYREEKDPVKQKQMREEEIKDLLNAIAANPNDGDLHARIGDAYFRNGQYDSAELHHMRAFQLNPESIILNDLAGEYFGKKRYEQAIDFCRKGALLNPNDANPYTNMGLCYMRLSRFDSAIHNLNIAISIDPKYENNYINMALTYKAVGNLDSAKKYEAIVQKSDPNFKL